MFPLPCTKLTRLGVLLSLALTLLFVTACSDDEVTADAVCSGHGEIHDDHCH